MKVTTLFFFLIGFSVINLAQTQPQLIIQENHKREIVKIAVHPYKDLIATTDNAVVKVWDSRSWKIIISKEILEETNTDWTVYNLEFDYTNQLIITMVNLLPDPGNYFNSYLLGNRRSIALDLISGDIIQDEPSSLIVPFKNQNNLKIYQLDTSLVFNFEDHKVHHSVKRKESLHDLSKSWFIPSDVEMQISFAKFNESEAILACGFTDGSIELREPINFELINKFETDLTQITDIHFSGDSLLYCEGLKKEGKIAVIDLLNKKVNKSWKYDCSILESTNIDHFLYNLSPIVSDTLCNLGIDHNNNTDRFAIGSQYNRIYLLNRKTKEETFFETPFTIISDLVFSKDGKELFITGIYSTYNSDIHSQSPLAIYNLKSKSFSITPSIIFDYAQDIGWNDRGDAFYTLNLSSYTKWNLNNLSRLQTNIVHKKLEGYTNFIKGTNQSFVEKPPSSDYPYIIRNFNENRQDSIYIPFLKNHEEDEDVVNIIPDKFVITSSYNTDDFFVYDLKSAKTIHTFTASNNDNIKLSKNGQWLVTYHEDSAQLQIINTNNWQSVFKFPIDRRLSNFFNIKNQFCFRNDNQQFAFFQGYIEEAKSNKILDRNANHIQVFSLNKKNKWKKFKTIDYDEQINILAFGYNKNTIITGSNNPPYHIRIWDFTSGDTIHKFQGHTGPIELIADHENMLLSKSEDNTYRLWDKTNSKETVKIMNAFNGIGISEIIMTKDNYYMSRNDGIRLVGYKLNDRGYPFEQFDLWKNRPDKVIAEIPGIDSGLINAYTQAYYKRLEKMSISSEALNESFVLPEISISSQSRELYSSSKNFTFEIEAFDKKHLLDRINIWVNDVPLFGKHGFSIKDQNVYKYRDTFKLELSTGKNKIQVSTMNTHYVESTKETTIKHYENQSEKADLYLVLIANSEYKNSKNNLDYPTIDMDSLIELFSGQKGFYNNIHVRQLYNENVNIPNVKAIKSFLLNTKVDDKVILAYAGHGLVDSDLDYYLSTYDVNFSDPTENGLSYEDLENLLDSIPARNKLLLVDACHSGEIDKGYLERIQSTNKKSNTRKFRAVGDSTIATNKLGIYNSFELMRFLFVDLRRSTGATVIASAGAVENALEENTWNNSAFIHIFLNALKRKNADGQITGISNGKITISELSAYLAEHVPVLTNGLQQPTSRVYNFENDWPIWQ